jgi:hypothetical protein
MGELWSAISKVSDSRMSDARLGVFVPRVERIIVMVSMNKESRLASQNGLYPPYDLVVNPQLSASRAYGKTAE